ncbi:molecular chaperone HtpG [Leptospira borgpetersenii]|uniref:molecular chaperone HtpG n=1 Tax=Leptospira borgpetersenii TaxID=174 RepID=UPI00034CF226|nr:molecular chaperone HtpG [Leptospira borgpetersenii]MBE8400344.1 molecular chaperone HtpG [Leptospira borgpetersenii serovar Tarassovi]MBE8402917.1 molecular chaperone HtpG [Leptospira borgpetersenii serovar Tarassovi]MBE8406637.1 molecular chaperone HtpG [Leptospira borgpetersenii serovar Tarassovi]MBE8411897.1 molecular chaperone HtpG [Leptospira borgpetersenii serovar Tarassovi]MBE8415047.1 molecular chaperone HtpG [Leptospira borgpetersenii serovar Tarassovi]
MSEEIKGRISVETENIFPIIKKWLYSEKDIFIRELVSNSSDAITKLKKIAFSEEFEGGTDYRIDLEFDQEKRILTIEDNGIGMSSEEVQKYINQIAFSSAEEFVKKFQGEGAKPEIIGHFGLGFYSCFMVSTKVVVETKSYKKGSTGVIWESESGTEFSLRSSDKTARGTKITLYLDGDSGEYLDQWKLKELVRKYCDFLPVPIYVKNEQANKQTPLWSEAPSSVTKEKYEEFYNYLFPFSGEPLFHVHLNVDYPFRLQGILYFPKLKHELDVNQSGIKLYCNHVFVSDDANDLVPKFLTVLKGTIDIPDLPLNVSRSYLQSDPLVKKISAHIVKKIADRLNEEFKKSEEEFRKNWDEISIFVKYGMLTDDKFYDAAKDLVFFKTSNGEIVRLEDYWNKNKEKNNGKIFYALETSSVYMDLLKSQGLEAILIDSRIDSHFIQFLESKNPDMKFQRADSELADGVVDREHSSSIVDSNNKTEADRIKEFFDKILKRDGLEIKAEPLKAEGVPAVVLLPEHLRRLSEMGMTGSQNPLDLLKNHTLVINTRSVLVKNILGMSSTKAGKLARTVYDMALLSSKIFGEAEFSEYLKRTTETLEELSAP